MSLPPDALLPVHWIRPLVERLLAAERELASRTAPDAPKLPQAPQEQPATDALGGRGAPNAGGTTPHPGATAGGPKLPVAVEAES